MLRALLSPLVALVAVAALGSVASAHPDGPVAHAAAVCADFPNQAAAQKAHNTRDADGDGIYCESRPCPCSTAAGGGGSTPSHDRNPARPRLGPSVFLGPRTRSSGCHVHGPLPDRACSPGARFKYPTRSQVCRSGYSAAVRNVRESTKDKVYAEYDMGRHFNGTTGEVDHIVSLELGGSNSIANLYPEAATPRPGSHEKDRLENALHDEVCSGQMTLAHALRLIATDWVAAYHARFN